MHDRSVHNEYGDQVIAISDVLLLISLFSRIPLHRTWRAMSMVMLQQGAVRVTH
jgi:hypothetical protein